MRPRTAVASGTSRAAARRRCKRGARSPRSPPGENPQPGGVRPPILLLERLQLAGVSHLHPAVLRSPAVEGVLANSELAAQVGDAGAGVVLFERGDDLLLGEAALSHGSPPCTGGPAQFLDQDSGARSGVRG